MGRVEGFEDLIAWQKARSLTRSIYELSKREALSRDFDLVRQLRRAAVSIMANIAEGMERTGPGEFQHFLSTAKASCAEVRSHLYVARDMNYISESQFSETYALAEEVGRIIGGLRSSIQKARDQR